MAGRTREAHMMPDHEPFDGTVGIVLKMPAHLGSSRWVGDPAVEDPRPLRAFPTWREAMNYATKEDHR